MLIPLSFQNWLWFSSRLNWALWKRFQGFPPGIAHVSLLAAPLLVYDFLWVVKSSGDPPGWEITWLAVRALLLQHFRRVNNSSVLFFHTLDIQGKVAFKPASFCLIFLFLFFLNCRSCSCWRCHPILNNNQSLNNPSSLVFLQVCSTKEYSECLGHRWRWMTSKMRLREVRRSSWNTPGITASVWICVNSQNCPECSPALCAALIFAFPEWASPKHLPGAH